jgi:hypothetical protein
MTDPKTFFTPTLNYHYLPPSQSAFSRLEYGRDFFFDRFLAGMTSERRVGDSSLGHISV